MTEAVLKSTIQTALLDYFNLVPSHPEWTVNDHATQMANAIGASVHAYAIALTTTNVSSHVHAIANPG